MSAQNGNLQAVTHKKHSAGKYIVGYLASLILTAAAFLLAQAHLVQLGPLLVVLMILAGFQIIVQLYFFMHITEGDGPPFHSAALLLGLFFTFAIALMSVWIMGFNSQVS